MNVAALAAEVMMLADGYEAAWYEKDTHTTLPGKMRTLAREAVRLAEELEDERSARLAIQQQRDQALTYLGVRAYRHVMRGADGK